MPDITKCTNDGCIQKESCYRFTSIASTHFQSYDLFVPQNNEAGEFKCDFEMNRVDAFSTYNVGVRK